MKHQWCEMGKRRFTVMRPMIGGGLRKIATVESRSVAEYLCDALDEAEAGVKLRKDVKAVANALVDAPALPKLAPSNVVPFEPRTPVYTDAGGQQREGGL